MQHLKDFWPYLSPILLSDPNFISVQSKVNYPVALLVTETLLQSQSLALPLWCLIKSKALFCGSAP